MSEQERDDHGRFSGSGGGGSSGGGEKKGGLLAWAKSKLGFGGGKKDKEELPKLDKKQTGNATRLSDKAEAAGKSANSKSEHEAAAKAHREAAQAHKAANHPEGVVNLHEQQAKMHDRFASTARS